MYDCSLSFSSINNNKRTTMTMAASATMTNLLLGMLLWTTQLVVHAQQQTECTRVLSAPLSLENGQVTIEKMKNSDDGTFTMRITAEGDAWIGIGINLDGRTKMTPTQSIIGRMEDETTGETSVWKYRLASDDEDASGIIRMSDELQVDLTNATFVQDGVNSILEFTHPLADVAGDMVVTDDSFWVYGVGLPDNSWMGKHAIAGGFQMSMTDNCVDSTGTTDGSDASDGIVEMETEITAAKNLFIAHGVCMALAWGLLAPLAIGASVIRSMTCLGKGRWFSLHLYLNNMVVLLTIVGFVLGVVATKKNEDDHFTTYPHTKVGLAIFVMIFVQAFIGYMRPPAPKAPAPTKDIDSNGAETPDSTAISNTLDKSMSQELSMDDSEEETLPSSPSPPHKPPIRLAWEIGHRLLGLALLAMAWYNCTSGIQLHVGDYGEDDDSAALWIGLFWIVPGGISFVVLHSALFRNGAN